jgi:hypothetical protein
MRPTRFAFDLDRDAIDQRDDPVIQVHSTFRAVGDDFTTGRQLSTCHAEGSIR